MKIIIKNEGVRFEYIPVGDLFAAGDRNELYVKAEFSALRGLSNVISIRDGKGCSFRNSDIVKQVKSIEVEFE